MGVTHFQIGRSNLKVMMIAAQASHWRRPDTCVAVTAAQMRMRTRMRRTAEDIVEIGRDLIAVKERLPHGAFGAWLEAEFDMGTASAARFMHVTERFGKSITMINLPPTILYALAAPSTPDEVVAKVEAKAEAGEKVSLDEVKALKRAAAEAGLKAAREQSREKWSKRV